MATVLATTWILCGSTVGASFSCETAMLELDDAGRLVSLRDLASGREYAIPGGPFCQIETSTGALVPQRLTVAGESVAFHFPGGARLVYDVESGPGYILFKLREMPGVTEAGATTIRHCALRLTGLTTIGDQMNAYFGDSFAVAVMGTQVNVQGYPVPAAAGPTAGVELRAETHTSHGLIPAGFGIVATPRDRFETAIADLEVAAGLPSPRPGGAWGKTSPLSKQSYLFITGFHERDADEVIRWARRGGFETVLIGGDWSRSHGHHEINTDLFPDGLASLERTCDKLHAAGLRVGLHFLGAAVYLDDPYVTPVPDRRLVVDAQADLVAGVDERADFIPMVGPPTGFAAEDGGYMGRGTIVRVDDELIQYGELRLEPPCGLARCARGALGTTAARHDAGAPVLHLQRSYGYFLYDLDSTLADEVVGNVCRVANAVRADMLYFDGSELLQGDHWYYNAKLQDLYYRKLANKDTFLQGSSYSHYSWHLISRMASADGHGDVKGYLDERLPWLVGYADNLMPADVGWYYVYEPKVTADQFDYVLQKCLGFDSSISVQTNPTELRSHPEMGAILDLVAEYERLRLGGTLPESTGALLREPGREYRLLHDPLRLRRTVFGKWQTVRDLGAEGEALAIEWAGEGARLGLQVRCGPLVRPGSAYHGEGSVLLEDFDDLTPYGPGGTNEGVTQDFASVDGEGVEGARCGKLTATSTRPDDGGWSYIGKSFDPPLDLSWHKGIGFWLRGDGGGGLFKLQIRDPEHATDYYIANDFADWRYFQVLRPGVPQPEPVDYSRIAQLLFYYNGLPGGKTVTCWVDDIRALAQLDEARIVDPRLTFGGLEVVFPATLTEGERLVYFPGERPYVIPATAGERRLLPGMPDLALSAPRQIIFSAQPPTCAEAEVRLVQDVAEEVQLTGK